MLNKTRTTIAALAATLAVSAAAPAVSLAKPIQAWPADPSASRFKEDVCARHGTILTSVRDYGTDKLGAKRSFDEALDAASADGCVVLF